MLYCHVESKDLQEYKEKRVKQVILENRDKQDPKDNKDHGEKIVTNVNL
jgi:hypothetical protein